MLKHILMGTTIILACFAIYTVALIIDHNFLAKKIHNQSIQAMIKNDEEKKKFIYEIRDQVNLILHKANRLVEIPLIGQYFMKHKLFLLSQFQQWEAIINEAKIYSKTPYNRYSYPIWNYKFMAQKRLRLYDQAEDTLKMLEIIDGYKVRSKQQYVELYRELSMLTGQRDSLRKKRLQMLENI